MRQMRDKVVGLQWRPNQSHCGKYASSGTRRDAAVGLGSLAVGRCCKEIYATVTWLVSREVRLSRVRTRRPIRKGQTFSLGETSPTVVRLALGLLRRALFMSYGHTTFLA